MTPAIDAPPPPRDFAPPDREVAALAASLAVRMSKAFGSKWVVAETVGAGARLRGKKLEAAIVRAVDAGLVERQGRPSGAWLRLAGLGESLFGPGPKYLRPAVVPDGPGEVPDQAAILAELAGMPHAVVPAEALALRLDADVVGLWDALGAAARAGWVETWPDHPRGPCAMLSALSAGRLGLTLSSDGSLWLHEGEKDPTVAGRWGGAASETDCSAEGSAGIFAETADPGSPDGPTALIEMEQSGRLAAAYPAAKAAEDADLAAMRPRARRPRRIIAEVARRMEDGDAGEFVEPRLPMPTMLLGIGRPWPFAGDAAGARDWRPGDGPCPQCGGRPLPASAVCCICWRSGVDHLLQPRAEAVREAEEHDRWINRGISVPDAYREMAS